MVIVTRLLELLSVAARAVKIVLISFLAVWAEC